jgi:hypothetical protein
LRLDSTINLSSSCMVETLPDVDIA